MKQSNTGINHTYQSSFTPNDCIYEAWHDGRYEMASGNYENIDIDTVKAKNIFAESVIDFLNSEFNLSLSYDGLYMPKFYNYESDKINFSYNDNDFDLLLNAIKDYELSSELESNIKNVTTSRDGYIAFYNEHELKADNDLYIRIILETLFNSYCVQDEYVQYYDCKCICEKLEDSVIYLGDEE